MNAKRMSVVVLSCDAYSDLWEDFFRFVHIYWKDIPYDFFLVSNNKDFKAKGVKVIKAGDSNWSTRARIALEQITTPFVMIFLEDYYLSEKVENIKIEKVISYIESERIDYYQLNIAAKEDYPKWSNYKEEKYLYNIPKTRNYWVDTSVSIWNKNFLLELLGKEDYSAWKFELDRNEDSKHPERYEDNICVLDSRCLISTCPMVIQGKLYPESIRYMERKGHKISISNRKIMSSKEVRRYKLKRLFAACPFGKNILKIIGRKLGYVFISDFYKQ